MAALAQDVVQISRAEVLRLGAADSVFYCRYFFPRTFRDETPDFHREFWKGFDDQNKDFFAAEMFRGAGKTTLTRAGISKRVAYAISRNILAVAIAENMAIPTVRWLKKQVETQTLWAQTFMLQKGSKWTDDWIEITNVAMDCQINVIAKGMTSGLRGLNFDDYRPDFVLCDDIENEETVGTEQQRNKNEDLFFGALIPSIAPKTEAPFRKLVFLQTNLSNESLLSKAHKDPAFTTVQFPLLVKQPDGSEKSAWEARFPTAQVLAEKELAIKRGTIHTWYREFGCKIISRETAPLDVEFLRKWTSLPTNLAYYLGLDPAISDQKHAHKAAAAVIGINHQTGDTYLVSYKARKGLNPDELWEWVLGAYLQFRPRKTGCETVAFQKMLKWYFEKKMQEAKRFFHITEVNDRRNKSDRIIQAYVGLASQGRLWVNEDHTEFLDAYANWVEGTDSDILDAGAQAITLGNPWMALAAGGEEAEDAEMLDAEKDIPELTFEGGAP